DFAGALDANGARYPTASAYGMGRTCRTNLDVRREADTHVFTLLPKLGLLPAQAFVVGLLQGEIERRFIVRAVVDNAPGGLERKFAWLWKVLPTDLRGVYLQFLCSNVHYPFDQVSRLRPAGAAVGV